MTTTQSSTATNVTAPDLSLATSTVDATKYFNNFYATKFTVSAGANDAVLAFFEQYTQNKIAANNLTAAIIYTAQAQNLNPLTVLSEFQALPKGQLNSYLTAFLNVNRAPTSVLGINNGTKTSPYITRSILL